MPLPFLHGMDDGRHIPEPDGLGGLVAEKRPVILLDAKPRFRQQRDSVAFPPENVFRASLGGCLDDQMLAEHRDDFLFFGYKRQGIEGLAHRLATWCRPQSTEASGFWAVRMST